MEVDQGIALRFREIRKELKIIQAEYAEIIGISRGLLSGLEKGRFPITERNIKAVCKAYNVNEIWLKTGQGDMFNPFSDHVELRNDEEKELIRVFRKLAVETKHMVIEIIRKFMISGEIEGAPSSKNDKISADWPNDERKKRA